MLTYMYIAQMHNIKIFRLGHNNLLIEKTKNYAVFDECKSSLSSNLQGKNFTVQESVCAKSLMAALSQQKHAHGCFAYIMDYGRSAEPVLIMNIEHKHIVGNILFKGK